MPQKQLTNEELDLAKSIVEVALKFVEASQNKRDSQIKVFGSSTLVKGKVYDFFQIVDRVSVFNKETKGEIIYDFKAGKLIKSEGITEADLDNWREALNLVSTSYLYFG